MTNHNFLSRIDAFLESKVVVEWFALQISILVQSNYLNNQISSVNFSTYGFLLTELKQKLPFLRTALGPWRRLSVSILWQLKLVTVSFGFHTFIIIFQKIVNDIQRFRKTGYFPISLSPSQFSNLNGIFKKENPWKSHNTRKSSITSTLSSVLNSILDHHKPGFLHLPH